jgi:hypothetical protein
VHHGPFDKSRLTRHPGTKLLRSATIFNAELHAVMPLIFSHASRENYLPYPPPELTNATMFAPCLLGCPATN